MKHILNAAKVVFSLVVLTFTSWQSYNLLQSVVGKADPLTPLVGIALFAGGFVFWSNLYTRDKESTAVQHAAALGGAVLCMLLDGTGAALHLLVGGQTLVTVDQNIGWWIIGVIVLAAVLNIGLLFIHETHSQTAIEQRRAASERHQEEDAQDQRGELRHEYRQAEIDFERDVVKDTIRELKTQKRTIAQKLAQDRARVAAANLLASMDADPARYLGTAPARAELPAPMVKVDQPAPAPKIAEEYDANLLAQWWKEVKNNFWRIERAVGGEATHQPTHTFAHVANSGAGEVHERWEDDPQPAPVQTFPTNPRPRWVLDDLLKAAGMTRDEARERVGDYSPGMVYGYLADKLPADMTRADFDKLFAELKAAPAVGQVPQTAIGPLPGMTAPTAQAPTAKAPKARAPKATTETPKRKAQ